MKLNINKLHINLILINLIILILFLCVFCNYSSTKYNVYRVFEKENKMVDQSVIVNSSSLLTQSTLSDLDLTFSKLPTLTVRTNYMYEIEGEDGIDRTRPQIDDDTVKQPIRSISFLDLPYNQKVDIEVEAFFENCGTLNDKNIDMKIVYSDFYSAEEYIGEDETEKELNNSKVLWWTAYGIKDNQNIDNEWYQRGFENINMKIYFYINGEETIVPLENAYFSFYGLEGENEGHTEAISSKNASKVYLYENTNITYKESSLHGETTYNDIYYGTTKNDVSSEKTSAVSFLYKNVDYIDVNLHVFSKDFFSGYHVDFSALSSNFEGSGVKEVSVNEAIAGEEISYTISYQMPISEEPNFTISTLMFSDELNENLIYKNLSVYDENNNDITEAAGIIEFKDNIVKYAFNSSYLSSISYIGQNYKFVIQVQVNENPTVNQISNTATITLNDENTFTTNSANIDLISYVIVRHFDEYGNELQEPVTMKGKLFEEYNAEAGGYLYYEILELPENAIGTFLPQTQEVNYTYIKTVTDYEVYKVWVDDTPTMEISDIEGVTPVVRPDSIKLKLSSNIEDEVQIVEMKNDSQATSNPYGIMTLDTEEETITDNNVWYYKFEDLPRFDENNEEIVYSVTEYDVPEGYFMSTCINDSDYGIATIANTRQTVLIINSYDSYTNEPLEGTVFLVEQIYNGEAYLVGEYTTNSAGMAIVAYINDGTYRITQIKAPDGYALSSETYEAIMDSSQAEVIVDVPNKPRLELPETGGNGIKNIILIGTAVIITSLIIINWKKESRKGYNLKHRY